MRLPQLVTYKGIGTTLFCNTKPDEQGRFYATRWIDAPVKGGPRRADR
ncbi:hypothetical protein KGQ20_08885 [Catenulispora sp. NF23]|uniref:Uncharacterized protein n=1 Tax=Catenulispora pinistramenti TaxID=2705254 RepID=A0ABS5KME7_9ACTN|nr:hypothetical protein [Catenulispora pinistramenti]MBS2532888.1 hypothetical protein [Catenulispora pinistramenti]MBS2547191.1 hypothetical protein [Catenulispora pinistramenti]